MPMLYEIEGKQLFKENRIPVPLFKAYTGPESVKAFVEELGKDIMMAKAQALSGGRGKAGLIKKVTSAEADEYVQSILGRDHRGKSIELVMLEEPMEITNEMKIGKMLVEYGFFDISRNPDGSFVNDLVDNNDGTVTDKATGLMWQKSGSSTRLDNQRANIYIERSN